MKTVNGMLTCEECGDENSDVTDYDEADGQIMGQLCTDCYLAQWNALDESSKRRSFENL